MADETETIEVMKALDSIRGVVNKEIQLIKESAQRSIAGDPELLPPGVDPQKLADDDMAQFLTSMRTTLECVIVRISKERQAFWLGTDPVKASGLGGGTQSRDGGEGSLLCPPDFVEENGICVPIRGSSDQGG